MATLVSIIAKLLGVKHTTICNASIEQCTIHKDGEEHQQMQVHVKVAPYKRVQSLCPKCGKKCPGYDTKYKEDSTWRAPNLNGAPVYIHYTPRRIQCPEHGVLTEKLPWTDGDTRFLKDFNDEVTYLATKLPKAAISEYMGINWRTVGNCIKATHNRLEPNVENRIHGVVRFCIDETSYKKGHKYITVIYDLDTNRVIWVSKGHGYEVFKRFCLLLSEEERKTVRLIAGDGAKWIDQCKDEFFPNAVRCIDPFHAVLWVNKAMDETRAACEGKATREFNREKEEAEAEAEKQMQMWLDEYKLYKEACEELAKLRHRRGRRSKEVWEMQQFVKCFEEEYGEVMDIMSQAKKAPLTEEQKNRLEELEAKSKCIKGCKYALSMNPENLSDYNKDRLELIKAENPDLYRAYQLKERIRVIIHMKDRDVADKEIDRWIKDARGSGFRAFVKLASKIEGHKEGILNSIEHGASSSKSEQTNGLIKQLIHIACGFRNLDNMFALIYLRCSDLVVPLANRYRPSAETLKQKRERANECRRKRQEQKMANPA